MAKDKKEKIQIYVVNSVKGGCGKTAFSIFKAMELAKEEREEDKNKKPEEIKPSVIWLDADFKGSATKALLYGQNKEDFNGMNKDNTIEAKKKKEKERDPGANLYEAAVNNVANRLCFHENYVRYTLNDYLREKITQIDKMIIAGYVYGEYEQENYELNTKERVGCINGLIDFIFASSSIQDKKIFNYGSGSSAVEIGRFTYRMRTLLSKLFQMGSTRTKAGVGANDKVYGYKHIVVDMPPGDDVYSNALLQVIRQLAAEQEDYEIEIHNYLMTTNDRGHRFAMLESMQDTHAYLEKCKRKETTYVVLSEVREKEFDNQKPCMDQIAKQNNENETKVLINKFQEQYYKFCRDIPDGNYTFQYEINEVH